MAAAKRIGLFYETYGTLPAYVIYIQNLVRTLDLSTDAEKPHLVILHHANSPVEELKATGYPKLEFYELQDVYKNPIQRAVNKLSRIVTGKNIWPFVDRNFPKDLDIVFPYNFRKECAYVKHKLVWKPDFQEYHLPQFFTLKELQADHNYLLKLSKSGLPVVLSSEDARRDYEKYHPRHNNQIFIWRFTSYLPDFSRVNTQALLDKHGVTKKYFVVANQFWPHKNHLTVLKATLHCREKNFQVIFTGKQGSARDPQLFDKLQHFIRQNALTDRVVFSGFIAREEQLAIIKGALAVIQPSLFEGWSTVIEDCKALNKFVIASSLSVNREQIKNNVRFFDPLNARELATIIDEVYSRPPSEINEDYAPQIAAYNNIILETFRNLS